MSVNTGEKMLTNDEREMVRDLILLPYIDTMVSKSMREIQHSNNVLSRFIPIGWPLCTKTGCTGCLPAAASAEATEH
ncbi:MULTISPECIES: hypothetical protein [unclassified Paenibacillus]|uniref:hypothetical protein n=1 Tax=unclassified Paenibacillus TaxID=185978 RepID=UPI0031193C4D